MIHRRTKLHLAALLSCVVLTLMAARAGAEWQLDGVGICTYISNQYNVSIASDGSGGAIIAWADYRSGSLDIYAQRVDARGKALWTANGVAICTASGTQNMPEMIPDGSGGAIVAWRDARSGNIDVYAQRVSALGTMLWIANGVAVCTASTDQIDCRFASDGAGGAIFAWEDWRSGNADIYARRVNSSGTALWTSNGVAVCTAIGNQANVSIVQDGYGGALLAWNDTRNIYSDIYAQRLNSSGAALWAANGAGVCVFNGQQVGPIAVADGDGGTIICWTDNRNGNDDIYAQHLDGLSNPLWTANGIAVCTASGGQYASDAVPSGDKGAIVCWEDLRTGTDRNVYAQKISSEGSVIWDAAGVPVCTASGDQMLLRATSDEDGGAVIAWTDYRNASTDVYAGRIDAGGTVVFGGATPVCTALDTQEYPRIASDGEGGAIVAWYDKRSGAEYDIYAQRIERNGFWGYPAPVIVEVRDVPGDEGGKVNISWNASRLDPWPDELIASYTIWRAIAPEAALLACESGKSVEWQPRMTGASADDAPEKPAIRMESSAGTTLYWLLVGQVAAYHLETYSYAAPTLFDSSWATTEWHYFEVLTHGNDPDWYWMSTPDSGRSIDNLSPATPSGLAGEAQTAPPALIITWDRNTESDLDHYAVYRGSRATFIPSPTTLIGTTADTAWVDTYLDWSHSYYKVSAIDFHANEGTYALLSPQNVTESDMPVVPAAPFLAQNVPNPFNPSTRIAYGLAAKSHVSLMIYDAAGRLVRTLIEEERAAGRAETLWDGRDNAGFAVASGIYFCRMETAGYAATRKMLILR